MNRWKILERKKSIIWEVKNGAGYHTDDIEMSGYGVSQILKYGVDGNGLLFISHHPVFPSIRRRKNDTHGSYQTDIPKNLMPHLLINNKEPEQKPVKFIIDGTLKAVCETGKGINIEHQCYPDESAKICYEKITVINNTDKDTELDIKAEKITEAHRETGCMGICIMEIYCSETGSHIIRAGEKFDFYISIAGRLANEKKYNPNPKEALTGRYKKIERLTSTLCIDSGNAVLDTLFTFANIRSGESVFTTKAGNLHSPGGQSYYAAVWCNDEVEYAGPHFAYRGDEALIKASSNAYNLYKPFMSDEYLPIPSSIIAEGIDFWNGAGDRGDAAMYLYGASRFALTCGRREISENLWEAIKWCAEYCRRMINENGVVISDSDELENRFSSGNTNLSTSSLSCAGYRYASRLATEMGDGELGVYYKEISENLEKSIEKYFCADIHGYETYRYHEGCEKLRSWICLPLCMGFGERSEGTARALLSEYLLVSDGLLTEEGTQNVWDRSTLYALRGLFASGYGHMAEDVFIDYCNNRLLGERVPYPVEAYPEGERRHLSAESALFCNIITEGILGFEPLSMNSFSFSPSVPSNIGYINLRNIKAFGGTFDIEADTEKACVICGNKIIAQCKTGERTKAFIPAGM